MAGGLSYLALGAFAGLRTTELQRLDWSEIDLDRGYITVAIYHNGAMNQESCFDDLVARAEEGDAEAQFMLGELYNSEGGVTIDEIAEWYKKAAKNGTKLRSI